MQRKSHCAPIEEIGVTIDRMVTRHNPVLLSILYVLAIAAVAVLFFLLLP